MGLVVVWGTGSLCEAFFNRHPEVLTQVDGFIDASRSGQFKGKPVLDKYSMPWTQLERLIICSSFVSDIIRECETLGVELRIIEVVLSSDLKLIPFCHFTRLNGGIYYYLPWKERLAEIDGVLSADIVFQDAYKELAKSVAYAFIAAVEGDFAEFGTCSGYSASLISYAVDYYSRNLQNHETMHHQAARKLRLFDSFAGFPKATSAIDIESPHVSSGAWGEGTAKGLSEARLANLCSTFIPAQNILTYAGWYKDTLPTISADVRFAFVHLDCDLYESTLDVLQHLLTHRHLSEGCILLFDNWFCNKASRAYGEQRAWAEVCEKFDIQYTNLGIYAAVGNRLIIHSYQAKGDLS